MPPDEWFGQQAVYRVSLGNFLLFTTLALLMSFPAPVKYTSDWRDKYVHHGNYLVRACLWVVFNAFPFFLPNSMVNAYAWVARIASPAFLGIQMLIIIDMSNSWNEAWVAAGEEDVRYLYALLIATTGAYASSIVLTIFGFVWFAPAGQDCSLNISLNTLGLLLILGFTLLTFHPTIREHNQATSLFVSSCTALYCSYLGFSALQSEPRDYECNGLGARLNAASGTTLAAGMLLTLLSTVWAAFRAGSNTHTFTTADASERELPLPLLEEDGLTSSGLDGSVVPPAREGIHRHAPAQAARQESAMSDFVAVSYSYPQFYLVFALASMYLAMLMTGWGSGVVLKDQIDVGWPSVWVKIVSQWIAGALYAWTLIAPAMFPDRNFGY